MAEVVLSQLVLNVLIIAGALIALNWASNLTIGNALKVSAITKLGKTAVGFSLLAFSTSLPELTVALIAAFSGGAEIAVGNVFGSNIANISLVLGMAAVLFHLKKIKGKVSLKKFILQIGRHLKPKRSKSNEEISIVPAFAKSELSSIYFGLFMASIVPMILIYISGATWGVGLLLLFIFVGYMYRLTKVRIPSEIEETNKDEKANLRRYVLLTLGGTIGIVVSAYFLVESSIFIATSVGLSQQLIGATIIALGTSLPELTITLKSILGGHSGLALGNIIGSSFVNITLILGLSLFVPALLGAPMIMQIDVFRNLVMFSIIINLFFWYFLSREKISWIEGLIFLFMYTLFIATTLGQA